MAAALYEHARRAPAIPIRVGPNSVYRPILFFLFTPLGKGLKFYNLFNRSAHAARPRDNDRANGHHFVMATTMTTSVGKKDNFSNGRPVVT